MRFPTNLATLKRFMGDGGVLTLIQAETASEGDMRSYTPILMSVPCVSADDATGSSLVLAPKDPKDDRCWRVMYGPASDWTFEGDLVYRETDNLWLAWEIDHA